MVKNLRKRVRLQLGVGMDWQTGHGRKVTGGRWLQTAVSCKNFPRYSELWHRGGGPGGETKIHMLIHHWKVGLLCPIFPFRKCLELRPLKASTRFASWHEMFVSKLGAWQQTCRLVHFLKKRQRISWFFKVKIKVCSQLKQKSLNVSRSVFFRVFHSVPILVEPLIYLLKMPWVAWSAIIWSQKGGKVLLFFGVCR